MRKEGHSLRFGLRDQDAVEWVFVWRGIFGAGEGFEEESMLSLQAKFADICIFTFHH